MSRMLFRLFRNSGTKLTVHPFKSQQHCQLETQLLEPILSLKIKPHTKMILDNSLIYNILEP